MICEAWALVVVPFPFVDTPAAKRRPALVLSRRAFNEANGHSLLAMVTTAARSAWPSDHPIAAWEGSGLRTRCVVRFKLFTLENGLIEREIGRLGGADRGAVADRVAEVLSFAPSTTAGSSAP